MSSVGAEAQSEAQGSDLSASLRGQALSSLPKELFLRRSLTSLDVSRNVLTSLPEALLNLDGLRTLNASHNLLESLPLAVSTLRHLEYLDVRHNALVTLPAGLDTSGEALQLFATPQRPGLALELPARASHTLFCDADFPATAASLFRDKSKRWAGHPPVKKLRWLRPDEICKAAGAPAPQLFVGDSDASDVVQGLLGDCWLLSAIAVVAQSADRLRHVFAYAAVEGSRAGSLTLQLYVRGAWQRVTIDDRLPCAADGSLLYAHSTDPNEMWVALLEKAFAKVYGSYESLISGFADVAMRDLTGGAPQRVRFTQPKSSSSNSSATAGAASCDVGALWQTIKRWTTEGSPVGCAFSTAGMGSADAAAAASRLSPSHCGILFAHAYGLEKVAEVAGRRLLRLRNPWGRGEWSGAWSDEASEWTPELLAMLDYEFADDGTFWMEINDFVNMFNTLYSARLFGSASHPAAGATGTLSGGSSDSDASWVRQILFGEWTASTAGGSPKHERWRDNPCVLVTLHAPTHVFPILSQPDPRATSSTPLPSAATTPAIGYMMVRRDALRPTGGVKAGAMAVRGLPLRSERDVGSDSGEVLLDAGEYVLVPFASEPGVPSQFRIEIHSSSEIALEQRESVHSVILSTAPSGEKQLGHAARGPPPTMDADDMDGEEVWDAADDYPDKDAEPSARFREMERHEGRKERAADRAARQLSAAYMMAQREELSSAGWSTHLAWADDPVSLRASVLQVKQDPKRARVPKPTRSATRRAKPSRSPAAVSATVAASASAAARATSSPPASPVLESLATAAASTASAFLDPRDSVAMAAYTRNSSRGEPRTKASLLRQESAALVRSAASRLLQTPAPSSARSPGTSVGSAKTVTTSAAASALAAAAARSAAAEAANVSALNDAQQHIFDALTKARSNAGSNGGKSGGDDVDQSSTGNLARALSKSVDVPGSSWRDAVFEAQRRRDELLDSLLARHRASTAIERRGPWKPG